MDINIEKCRRACDLLLHALSDDESISVETQLKYYHQLVNLVDEYEKMRRKIFGLEETVRNLRRREQKTYDDYSWRHER